MVDEENGVIDEGMEDDDIDDGIEEEEPVEEIRQERVRHDRVRLDDDTKPKGRPSLKSVDLTLEMKQLAELMGRGMPAKDAGEHLGLSRYQIKTYSEDRRVLELSSLWRTVLEKDELARWVMLYDDVVLKAFKALERKIENDEVLPELLIKLVEKKLVVVGGLPISTKEMVQFQRDPTPSLSDDKGFKGTGLLTLTRETKLEEE